MNLKYKKLILILLKRKTFKLFLKSIKDNSLNKQYHELSKNLLAKTTQLKIDIALNTLIKLGYTKININHNNTSLFSVESHVGFSAIPKKGKITRQVVLFLTLYNIKSLIQQNNINKKITWLTNGQSYTNCTNKSITY